MNLKILKGTIDYAKMLKKLKVLFYLFLDKPVYKCLCTLHLYLCHNTV